MKTGKSLLAIFVLFGFLASGSAAQNAPNGPGDIPTWTTGGKEAVGTSTSLDSKVWFTLQGGILTEVYYPRLDTANVRTLEFAVSDGKRVWVESKDMVHTLERISDSALLYRQTSSEPGGKFQITKTYATDPQRHALLLDIALDRKSVV